MGVKVESQQNTVRRAKQANGWQLGTRRLQIVTRIQPCMFEVSDAATNRHATTEGPREDGRTTVVKSCSCASHCVCSSARDGDVCLYRFHNHLRRHKARTFQKWCAIFKIPVCDYVQVVGLSARGYLVK